MTKRHARGQKHAAAAVAGGAPASRPGEGAELQIVGLVLAVKALVLLFGAQSFTVNRNLPVPSLYGALALWNNWDAPHYLDIARDGYVDEGVAERWIVFLPLYPWLVRLFALAARDELLAAFFVSSLASVAAALLLYRLAALDDTERVARASVFFMLAFPTAYFLHIGYTESLFLALALGAFLAARRRVWWAAGVLGALASLTRLNGLLLVPALAFEALAEYRESGRRFRREWLWVGFAALGFVCYLGINLKVQGHPFAFMEMQERHWQKTLAWPWAGVVSTLGNTLRRQPSEAQMVGWQELFFLALGLGCTAWCWLRWRTSYAVWMSLNWLLFASTKFLLSVPRYTLVMFPVYVIFARAAAARPAWGWVITVWSLLFMALFITRFVQGFWAF